jgi:hypothetical protein
MALAASTSLATPHAALGFDVERPAIDPDPAAMLRRMSAACGRPYRDLVKEFASLALGPGRISIFEYEALRLYDQSLGVAAKRRFVGAEVAARIWSVANFRPDYYALADIKVAANGLFAAHGFPTADRLALFRLDAGMPSSQLLHTRDELRAFLARAGHYPLFGKPMDGLQSLGAVSLDDYDAVSGRLLTADGRALPLDAFVEGLAKHYPAGYVFQKRLSPHRDVRRICGDRLATVRLITILADGEPILLRSTWKIPAGGNVADNFWRKGNLLGQLEPDTGRVLRVLRGVGVGLEELTHHPDTGAPIQGMVVPNWRDVTRLAIEGARVVKDLPLIGWDIASVDGGAVMIELNHNPDFLLTQLADGRGMLDDILGTFLDAQRRAALHWRRETARGERRRRFAVLHSLLKGAQSALR